MPKGGIGNKTTHMGAPLRNGRGDRAHLSSLEENTPKDQYKLIKLLYVKKNYNDLLHPLFHLDRCHLCVNVFHHCLYLSFHSHIRIPNFHMEPHQRDPIHSI